MSRSEEIRVLHITAVPMTAALLVAPIAKQQVKSGYRVEFACGPGEYLDKLQALGLPITLVPFKRQAITISNIIATYKLLKLIRHRQYQIVHLHSPIAAFWGRLAANLAKTPIVIYHMRTSWWESDNLLTRLVFTLMEWIAGHWTTHIFSINCSDARDLVRNKIVTERQVTCLHCGACGIDVEKFQYSIISVEKKAQLRNKLRIESSNFVVGYIGRVVEEKGILDLIDAFKKVKVAYPSAKLLIVGDTLSSERDQQTRTSMQQAMTKYNLHDSIIHTGFRDDIPEILSLMDVVVLPSHREGFGMVLAEAASMERPVISTDTRGGREAVVPNVNGLIVPIQDVNALFEAIMRLIAEPDLRHRMGKAGRRLAIERFDEKQIFHKLNEVYSTLLNK